MQIDLHLMALPLATLEERAGWLFGTLRPISKQAEGQLQKELSGASREVVQQTQDATREWDEAVKQYQKAGALGAVAAIHDWLHQFGGPAGVEIPEEALLEFVNLPDQGTVEAIDFIRKYGLFGLENIEPRQPIPSHLKTFFRAMRKSGQTPFLLSLKRFWAERQAMSDLLVLATGIQNRDVAAVKRICVRRMPPGKVRQEDDWLVLGQLCFNLDMSVGLHQTDLTVSQRTGKIVAHASAACVRPALYLALLSYATRGTELAQCDNEECRKTFVVARPGKRYCSKRCQVLVRVRRHRAGHPAGGAKGGLRRWASK